MVRIILGVIAGFVAWSMVWIGGEPMAAYLWPAGLGTYVNEVEQARATGATLSPAPAIVLIYLIRSFLTSIIGGYIAALVAGEYRRSTMILGVILVAVGAAVEYMFWNLAPTWYHILFVLFLIPMTILGGRLRRPN